MENPYNKMKRQRLLSRCIARNSAIAEQATANRSKGTVLPWKQADKLIESLYSKKDA